MNALITGISGFVGLYLSEHLLASGDRVLGCEPDGRWNAPAPPVVRRSVDLVCWDLTEPLQDEARRRIEAFSPDCIYHLAAISIPSVCGGAEPSDLAQRVNVEGTQVVLDLAATLDPSPRTLVTSSSHVYAPVSASSPVVAETAPLGPVNGYGKTKWLAEQRCRQAADKGQPIIVVRAFQHSGPRQLPMFMLPEWCRQFADPNCDEVQVITLDSHIDLSDVRDVVRAYRGLIENQCQGLFNVGSGASTRSGDVFEELQQLTGLSPTVVESRPGFRQQPIADISRLISATDWRPEIPLTRTIADSLAFYREQGV